MKNQRRSLRCVCVLQWPWVELRLINSKDDVALALLFFLLPVQSSNLKVSSPDERGENELAVFLQDDKEEVLCICVGGGGGVESYPPSIAFYPSFICSVHVIGRLKIQFNDLPPST